MKKTLTIAILFLITISLLITGVQAATSTTLSDELYAIGSQYGMTDAEKVKMQRYLADHSLTEAECNEILALANQADKIMKDNNTTDYKTLPADVKEKLKSLAVQAADIAGVTLDFSADGINVYKDGKLIESVDPTTSGKLAYTGNSSIALVVSSIAVIALAATVVIKTKSTKIGG